MTVRWLFSVLSGMAERARRAGQWGLGITWIHLGNRRGLLRAIWPLSCQQGLTKEQESSFFFEHEESYQNICQTNFTVSSPNRTSQPGAPLLLFYTLFCSFLITFSIVSGECFSTIKRSSDSDLAVPHCAAHTLIFCLGESVFK